MNISVENKIKIGLPIGLAALLGCGYLAYHATTKLMATEGWVSHTEEVVATLEAGPAILTDAEAAQRGYLLTGDERFLKECLKTQAQVDGWIEKVRTLTADNPEQQQRLTALRSLISRRLAVLNGRIKLRQEQGLQAAAGDVATLRQGEDLMDQARHSMAAMSEAEARLLKQRQQAAQFSAKTSVVVILTGSALACVVGMMAIGVLRRDFKLRTLAERKVHESRAQLESILNHTPAVVYLKDVEGRYLFVNRQFEAVTGFSRDRVVGRTAFDLFPREIALADDEHHRALLRAQAPMEIEETVLHPDGPHPHLAVKFSLCDAAGRVYATAGLSRDITGRKRAEEERDRFFNLSRDLMCVAGFDGYFKVVNPAWQQVLGFPQEELLGKPFIEFVHPDDRAATNAEAVKLAEGRETIHFENRYRCRDGSYRWLAWNARADAARKLIYAGARDVTEEKLAGERIRLLNEELTRKAAALESINAELEAFSYSVSHDLRAPLRHIDGFVKLLDKQSKQNLDERGHRYLNIIADSARQMGALIDDLLVFSRMGRSDLRRSRVATDALVHEAVDALQMETNGRPIIWKIGALPEVKADPAMLRQVWMNLIGNAVKYTRPRNPAEIQVGTIEAGNGEFVFFVRDNGVGFDMEYAHKLFGVFQRLHHAQDFEGTGIGLANVRRIISRHGGRTWAEGKPDGGATFYFSLPKTPPAAVESKG